MMKTIAVAAACAAFAVVAADRRSAADISALVDEIDADAAAVKPAPASRPVKAATPVQVVTPVQAVDKPAAAAADPDREPPAAEEPEAVVEPQVSVVKAAAAEAVAEAGGDKADGAKKPGKKPKAKKKDLTGRDAKISSATMSYDRKEGVIFFDRNVYVDDEQYQMHADRVYVFLSGTNDVKRLVALGNVALTNEFRSATCDKAVYVKSAAKVVLYAAENGVATLKDESEKGGTITGSKITFWLDSEQVEVQHSDITVPGGAFKAGDAKKLLGQ